MNTLKKRLISLALLCCFALASVTGCSDKNSSKSSESDHISANDGNTDSTNGGNNINDLPIEIVTKENGDLLAFPFQSNDVPNSNISNENGMNLSGPDSSSIDVSPQAPTESVTVVNEAGEPVTEANGQPVTEFVTVPTESSSENATSNYKSQTNGRYILWVDISKDENYVFNDEFVKVTMKIKEDIPDGDYPISFATDLSTIAGVHVDPDKIYTGTVRVGDGEIQAQDVSSETGFVVYGDNISCKQGDTVDFYINMKNNPGLAAVLMWFYYDSNAIEIEDVCSAGEFETFAYPQTGEKPTQQSQ
ncbi:MAG: hypothetical protein NC485_02610 [Ruminococcus flavefaciens]|nr:hypothetical protein [Ruminococcus flavefaciens]MCM1058990.1 hypothetical protein [Eubacterium sp.]